MVAQTANRAQDAPSLGDTAKTPAGVARVGVSSLLGGVYMAAVIGSAASAMYLARYFPGAHVPDYIAAHTPFFFLLMVVEAVVGYGRRSEAGKYELADSFSSISAGAVQQLFHAVALNKIAFLSGPYLFLYNQWRLFDMPKGSSSWTAQLGGLQLQLPHHALVWALSFILVDFLYYWFHRAAHEVSFAWAAHSVHHSSDRYNLTTSLRQSVVQSIFSAFFYLPMAILGIPPTYFFFHSSWNTLYQFWIHTVVVRRLPWVCEMCVGGLGGVGWGGGWGG